MPRWYRFVVNRWRRWGEEEEDVGDGDEEDDEGEDGEGDDDVVVVFSDILVVSG